MAGCYQPQIPNLFEKLRVNRSTLWRRQLKEKDPEKYRRYLEQQRVRSQVARNRLKLATNMIKNPSLKGTRFDRQMKMMLKRNSSRIRNQSTSNLPNNDFSSEKADEPKIVLDKLSHQIRIFKMFHILSSGIHLKYAQTLTQISVQYYWPTMREDIRKWVSDCKICETQSTKKNMVSQSDGSTSWQPATSEMDGNSGSWSKESIKFLLQAVAEIFGRRSLQIQTELELWTKIAKAVNLHGANISAATCKLKWQEMKKLYIQLKTGTKCPPSSSPCWSLYNIIDMIYKAFQTLTTETNMQPKFPFTSIFDPTEACLDTLNNSNLTSDSQIDQSNFPMGIYQNVYHNSSMQDNQADLANQDQNHESKEICESNPMVVREQKNNFDGFDPSLKAPSDRQYWNADQMHTISHDSFELAPNVDNSVSNLILPLAADFNMTVDAITASELQQEIKQEGTDLIQTISFPPAPPTSGHENNIYIDNPPKLDVITFKMEPEENLENLQVQTTSSKTGSDMMHANRTRSMFTDQDVLCLEMVASPSENKLNNNIQGTSSSSHDLNTVDLTYLSPEHEPGNNSFSFSEDQQASVVTSSKEDNENGNVSIVTTSQSNRHANKNTVEEELSPLRRAGTTEKGNTVDAVFQESVSSNMVVVGSSVDRNEDISTWFQQFMKEQRQHAAEQEKRMKEFQDSLLGLVRETNQQLATLIYIQRNEMKDKEKKDEEFKNTILNILKEKHK